MEVPEASGLGIRAGVGKTCEVSRQGRKELKYAVLSATVRILILILKQWTVTEVLKQESDIVILSISKRPLWVYCVTVYLGWSRVDLGRPVRRVFK